MEIVQDFRIIWRYLKKYKREVEKTALLAVASSILVAFVPYIYGRLVDIISLEFFSSEFALALLGIWLLMSVISAILSRFTYRKGDYIGIDASNDLVCQSAEHIIKLPLKFHKEKKIGEVFSKVDKASNFLLDIIADVVFWMLPQILSVFAGILILFFIEWRLALGSIIIFCGYILIAIYKTGPLTEIREDLNKTFEKAWGNLYDSFLNVQTVKSCAAEDFQERKTKTDFHQGVGPVFKRFVKSVHFLHLWQELFFSISFVAIFGFAIFLVRFDLLTPGKLITFLGYLNLFHAPLKTFAHQWRKFRTGITAIKRVEKLLAVKKEDYKKAGKVLEEVRGEIEFRNVSFGYKKDSPILTDISFIVSPGQKIAIVGGSGEGKTTLADLLSLYFIPSKGKILLDGTNIKELNLQFLRKIIAYVPQEIILFNDTVKNNIRYGKPDASDEELKSAAKAAYASRFIENLPKKYEQLVGERGVKLSGGQKQRLAIARALIQDPKILVLDEATSSLDVESEKMVQEALGKLIHGRTTFIIAHRLSTIQAADKILVLSAGRIIEQGNHRELIAKKGAYFRLYSLQFKK